MFLTFQNTRLHLFDIMIMDFQYVFTLTLSDTDEKVSDPEAEAVANALSAMAREKLFVCSSSLTSQKPHHLNGFSAAQTI